MSGLSKHHCFWPRRDYTARLERQFRNLPCNIVLLDDFVHRMVHRHSEPPHKPSHEEMVEAIRRHTYGECRCGKEAA